LILYRNFRVIYKIKPKLPIWLKSSSAALICSYYNIRLYRDNVIRKLAWPRASITRLGIVVRKAIVGRL
jgi:hypothetical protein